MVTQQKLNILHVLGQRPDSTGSGFYMHSIMREAAKCGHDNFMIAGIQTDSDVELHWHVIRDIPAMPSPMALRPRSIGVKRSD